MHCLTVASAVTHLSIQSSYPRLRFARADIAAVSAGSGDGSLTMLECNFNSRLSIGYHEFTRLFSTFSYNTDYENPGVVLPVSK